MSFYFQEQFGALFVDYKNFFLMLLFEIWWLSLLFSQNLDFLVDTQLVKQCAANNAKVNAKCRLSCFGFIFLFNLKQTCSNINRHWDFVQAWVKILIGMTCISFHTQNAMRPARPQREWPNLKVPWKTKSGAWARPRHDLPCSKVPGKRAVTGLLLGGEHY